MFKGAGHCSKQRETQIQVARHSGQEQRWPGIENAEDNRETEDIYRCMDVIPGQIMTQNLPLKIKKNTQIVKS